MGLHRAGLNSSPVFPWKSQVSQMCIKLGLITYQCHLTMESFDTFWNSLDGFLIMLTYLWEIASHPVILKTHFGIVTCKGP